MKEAILLTGILTFSWLLIAPETAIAADSTLRASQQLTGSETFEIAQSQRGAISGRRTISPAAQSRYVIHFHSGLTNTADRVEDGGQYWYAVINERRYPIRKALVDYIEEPATSPNPPQQLPVPEHPSNPDAAPQLMLGTAFFVSSSGFAITAAHVVAEASHVELLRDEGYFEATIVQMSSEIDLALLKATGNFIPVPVIPSDEVSLGTDVCTVGFPNVILQGLSPKATRGFVNSLTGLQDAPDYFQVSAEVNPGSSGGALIDLRGNVIGVILSMLDSAKAYAALGTLPQNVNYALKSNSLMNFIEGNVDLKEQIGLVKPADAKTPQEAIAALEKASYLVIAYP